MRFGYVAGRLRAVLDSVGRRLEFTYTWQGAIDEIHLEAPSQLEGRVRLTKYEYDERGNLIRVHDRAGLRGEYQYDGHRLVCHRNGNGAPTYAEYDNAGRCVTLFRQGGKGLREIRYHSRRNTTLVTDSLGHRTLYRFNESGGLVEEVDACGQRKRRIYDGQNRLLLAVGADGHSTLVSTYNPETRTLTEQRPVGGTTVTIFGENGLPERITNALGQERCLGYDALGRLTRIESPEGREWSISYDERGAVSQAVCPDGYVIHRDQSPDFSTITLRDDGGVIEQRRFDTFGNVVETTDALGHEESFGYDDRNQLVKHTLADGRTVTYRYDGEGNVVSETDALGRVTRYRYDGYAQLTEKINPVGQRECYEPDTEDRLQTVIAPSDERMVYEHDALGRPVRITHFDGSTTKIEYNDHGHHVRVISGDGGCTEFWYLASSLLLRRRLPDGSDQRFSYDELGELVAIEGPGYSLAFEYSPDGPICREQQVHATIEYEYNQAGMLSAIRDDTGREVRYEYGPRRALVRICDRDRVFELRSTGVGELVTGIEHPGGLRQELEYDVCDRLIRRRVLALGGAELARREYTYDAADQLTHMADSRLGNFDYSYDVLGRLVAVRRGGTRAPLEEYAYDANGNLVQTPAFAAISYGPENRALAAGSLKFEYDACGRSVAVVSPAGRRMFDYDGEGMLRRVRLPDGTVCEYEYDAFARRTLKRVKDDEIHFCWDVNLLRFERHVGGAGGHIEFLFLPGTFVPLSLRVGETTYHCSFDQAGTPTEMWDEGGNMTWSMAPDVYGARRNEIGPGENPFHFLGQYVDRETGLYYNRFRYYDALLGRFTTQDPLGIEPGLNLYQYPPNPLTWVDPLGLISGPTIKLKCRKSWGACEQRAAQMKAEKMNRQAKKKQQKRTEPCRTNQRQYYEDNCAETVKNSSTHDIDHLLELQIGGMDKCCSNLWEMPRRPNRSIGSQIKNRMNDLKLETGDNIGGFSITGCSKAKKCTNPPTPPDPKADCEQDDE